MTLDTIVKHAAAGIGCDPRAVWALAQIESGGGRALHRYEPHVFRRLTGRRAKTFEVACADDPAMAAAASSWGAFQVMGHYYQDLGYEDAIEMADALDSMRDTKAQAQSVIDYCTVTSPGSGSALRALDAEQLALRYNGPQGVARGYHIKFRAALARAGRHSAVTLSVGDTGDAVAVLQDRLGVAVDGHFGRKTEASVLAFQLQHGLKADGIVGAKTWAALELDTAAETQRGAPGLGEKAQVVIADNPGKTVGGIFVGSVLTGITGFEGLQATLDQLGIGKTEVRGILDSLGPVTPYLIPVALAGLAAFCLAIIIKDFRHAYREKRDADSFVANLGSYDPHQGRGGRGIARDDAERVVAVNSVRDGEDRGRGSVRIDPTDRDERRDERGDASLGADGPVLFRIGSAA